MCSETYAELLRPMSVLKRHFDPLMSTRSVRQPRRAARTSEGHIEARAKRLSERLGRLPPPVSSFLFERSGTYAPNRRPRYGRVSLFYMRCIIGLGRGAGLDRLRHR